MAPFGGVNRRFSTNPFSIGIPSDGSRPMLLLDMATSMVAEGKVLVASNGGKPLPAGTYTVTWRYAPKSLRAGLIASASGSLVFLTLAALWLRRTTGRRRYVGAAAHTL